jgi:hypothetical protein
MNAFFEHHKNNIVFNYRCFDRVCDIKVRGLAVSFFIPGVRAYEVR